jgi:CheY-like chemotaxis protein
MGNKAGRILCIDDHEDTCELISAILGDFEIVSARSVAEASRIAAEQKFDLILLDYHLPDGVGTDLCPVVNELQPKVPVVLMTVTLSINERNAVAAGATAFLDKGDLNFVHILPRKVASLLEQRTAGQ